MDKLQKSSNGSNRCISKKRNTLDRFIKIIKRIGTPSAQGEVFRACFPIKDCNNFIAIKKIPLEAEELKMNPDLLGTLNTSMSWREIFMLKLCNILRENKITNHVPISYKYHRCSKCEINKEDTRCILLLTELAEGDLKMYLDKEKPTLNTLKIIYFQIFVGLYCLNKHFGIIHNDLHWGNVLYHKAPEGGYTRYTFGDTSVLLPNIGVVFVIWDFGLSYIPHILKNPLTGNKESSSGIGFRKDFLNIAGSLYKDEEQPIKEFDTFAKMLISDIIVNSKDPKDILTRYSKKFLKVYNAKNITNTFSLDKKI